jgi:hypothetical protein
MKDLERECIGILQGHPITISHWSHCGEEDTFGTHHTKFFLDDERIDPKFEGIDKKWPDFFRVPFYRIEHPCFFDLHKFASYREIPFDLSFTSPSNEQVFHVVYTALMNQISLEEAEKTYGQIVKQTILKYDQSKLKDAREEQIRKWLLARITERTKEVSRSILEEELSRMSVTEKTPLSDYQLVVETGFPKFDLSLVRKPERSKTRPLGKLKEYPLLIGREEERRFLVWGEGRVETPSSYPSNFGRFLCAFQRTDFEQAVDAFNRHPLWNMHEEKIEKIEYASNLK